MLQGHPVCLERPQELFANHGSGEYQDVWANHSEDNAMQLRRMFQSDDNPHIRLHISSLARIGHCMALKT